MGYEVDGQDRPKKQIGTFLFNVLALNPTVDELRVLKNLKSDKEIKQPVYDKRTDGGVVGRNIVFWLKGKFGLKPVFFALYDCPAQNTDGTKRIFIDHRGNDTFAESVETISSQWVDKSTARVAYRGEREITQFMRALLDRSPENIKACRLDDPKRIIYGDLSELKSFIEKFAKQACCLIYGDAKGYTNVWSGGFGGAYTLENDKFWTKKLGDITKYGHPKGEVSIKVKNWDVQMDKDEPSIDPFASKTQPEYPHHSTIKGADDIGF